MTCLVAADAARSQLKQPACGAKPNRAYAVRMSQQIWEAKRQLDQGERLSRQVEDATLDFFQDLDESSQALVEGFQSGALKKRLANILDARFENLLADRV